VDILYKKPVIGWGTLIFETTGGHSIDALPSAENGARVRDVLLDLIHWTREEATAPAASQFADGADPADRLKRLKELYDAGVIAEDEFSEKKAELLRLL
jgi:hypothetical protein